MSDYKILQVKVANAFCPYCGRKLTNRKVGVWQRKLDDKPNFFISIADKFPNGCGKVFAIHTANLDWFNDTDLVWILKA